MEKTLLLKRNLLLVASSYYDRLIRTTQAYLVIFLVASGLLTPYCEWTGAIGISVFLSNFQDVLALFTNGPEGGFTKPRIDKESNDMIQSVVWFSWVARKSLVI